MQPEQEIAPEKPKKIVPGIGRVAFLVWFVVWAVVATVARDLGGNRFGDVFWLVVNLIILVPASASRLDNIGRSTWWSWLCLLPGLGLLVAIPCLFLPAEYGQTKKLH
jgi:uncharacterized membrane protein YhaH (DUF805 family)